MEAGSWKLGERRSLKTVRRRKKVQSQELEDGRWKKEESLKFFLFVSFFLLQASLFTLPAFHLLLFNLKL
jgi:hypothetical protein